MQYKVKVKWNSRLKQIFDADKRLAIENYLLYHLKFWNRNLTKLPRPYSDFEFKLAESKYSDVTDAVTYIFELVEGDDDLKGKPQPRPRPLPNPEKEWQ
jgi:hypothetical protein